MVRNPTHRLAYLFVGYGVHVVEDAHRVIDAVEIYRISVQGVIELAPFSR